VAADDRRRIVTISVISDVTITTGINSRFAISRHASFRGAGVGSGCFAAAGTIGTGWFRGINGVSGSGVGGYVILGIGWESCADGSAMV